MVKSSVVIATYNGSNFIIEELESIKRQTIMPDEVLILDDVSTDDTFVLCQKFIEENQLSNWKVIRNEKNLGLVANFFKGFSLATGDVIFIADQDDIWQENKIERILLEFIKNPNILSLTTSFSRFSHDIIFSKHVRHPFRKSNDIKIVSLEEFCVFPYFLGMSMAISKILFYKTNAKIVDLKNNEIDKEIAHDIYLNLFACMENGLYHLDKVLTKRRSYSESISNKKQNSELVFYNNNKKLSSVSDKIKKLMLFKFLININYDNSLTSTKKSLQIIENSILANIKKKEYLISSSIFLWFKNIFYLKHYPTLLTYLNDGAWLIKTKLKKGRL